MKKATTHAGCQNNEQGPTFSNYLPGNEPIPNSSDDEGAHVTRASAKSKDETVSILGQNEFNTSVAELLSDGKNEIMNDICKRFFLKADFFKPLENKNWELFLKKIFQKEVNNEKSRSLLKT